MASIKKRKILETQLQRRVRARRGTSDGLEKEGSEGSEISAVDDCSSNPSEITDNETKGSDNDPTSDEDGSSEFSEAEPVAQISFGALAKAQATLQRPIKRNKEARSEGSGTQTSGLGDTWRNEEALERKAGRTDHRDLGRSNKHAPTEVSSKKAVSRKRGVISVAKQGHRDPRFEPLSGPLNESKLQKVYSFLNDYKDDEIKELKSAIKKAKDGPEKEGLKRALLSLESKKKAQEKKRKEQEILEKHRKEEKELVKHGKRPFYLKKTEQQKRLLVDRYSELKGKQLDRVIERRRKKEEGKEKKKMPWSRREREAKH